MSRFHINPHCSGNFAITITANFLETFMKKSVPKKSVASKKNRTIKNVKGDKRQEKLSLISQSDAKQLTKLFKGKAFFVGVFNKDQEADPAMTAYGDCSERHIFELSRYLAGKFGREVVIRGVMLA